MAKGWRKVHQKILNLFKERGVGNPVTLAEIKAALADERDDPQRRLRDLREHGYQIKYDTSRRVYVLLSETPSEKRPDTEPISGKLRAEVRLAAHGRCGMCGKTIAEDGIKLVVDHRIPRAWGGETERSNLWAICEKCNIQKRHFFEAFDPEVMKRCIGYSDVRMRLGEMLKVYKGQPTPRRLLEVVGQEEQWHRRLRELRDLGWKVKRVRDPNEKGRYAITYQLVEEKPWPENISAALREAQRRKKKN